jgi:multidrug efflux pump subunit AcrB
MRGSLRVAARLDATFTPVDTHHIDALVAGSHHETSGEFASTDARDINVTLARDINVTLARVINVTLTRDDAHARLTSLDKIYIPTSLGARVPLARVASIVLEPAPTTIRHFHKERSVTVTSFVAPGFNTDRVTKELLSRLGSLDRPPGHRLVAAREIERRQESFGGMGTAILVATFGILAILMLEFRTFRSTMIVASVIPLGIGGVAARARSVALPAMSRKLAPA